jgi:hypothetical protein
MAKCFTITPFLNLLEEDLPSQKDVDLPEGCSVECQQYANHVYFVVHHDPEMAHRLLKRKVILASQGHVVPNNFTQIGCLILNELDLAGLGEESDEGDEEMDMDDMMEVPKDAETFYRMLTMVNIYIGPESRSYTNSRSWSFLGDSHANGN